MFPNFYGYGPYGYPPYQAYPNQFVPFSGTTSIFYNPPGRPSFWGDVARLIGPGSVFGTPGYAFGALWVARRHGLI